VPAAEQIRRTIPVIAALRKQLPTLLSIDTTQSEVAKAALENGANVINDISAGKDDPNMLPLCAAAGAPIVLMHMQGTPATMQNNPNYVDVIREVADFLIQRRDAAMAAGIDRRKILLDPGLGFGKSVSHNLRLLRDTAILAALGQPLVVAPSRKGFVGQITGESAAGGRVFGTAAAVAWCVANHAAVLRVHDVGPMAAVVKMTRAICRG
jgi:dihydropteroate synthase